MHSWFNIKNTYFCENGEKFISPESATEYINYFIHINTEGLDPKQLFINMRAGWITKFSREYQKFRRYTENALNRYMDVMCYIKGAPYSQHNVYDLKNKRLVSDKWYECSFQMCCNNYETFWCAYKNVGEYSHNYDIYDAETHQCINDKYFGKNELIKEVPYIKTFEYKNGGHRSYLVFDLGYTDHKIVDLTNKRLVSYKDETVFEKMWSDEINNMFMLKTSKGKYLIMNINDDDTVDVFDDFDEMTEQVTYYYFNHYSAYILKKDDKYNIYFNKKLVFDDWMKKITVNITSRLNDAQKIINVMNDDSKCNMFIVDGHKNEIKQMSPVWFEGRKDFNNKRMAQAFVFVKKGNRNVQKNFYIDIAGSYITDKDYNKLSTEEEIKEYFANMV